jgi:perosamine synthetase
MIPIFQPNLGDEELNEIADTFNSHWIGLGPKTKIFEDQFASYIGCKNAISVNSATAALHISLIVSDVQPGDEVLVSAITFVSSAHVVIYCGAIPILVDVDTETLQMDPQDMQRKITDKTKAVIAVHYGYHPCEMDEIIRIARSNNIAIVEDAANCAGAEYNGKKIGNLESDYTCFSFEAKKNMTTGDGGMITTNKDGDIIDKIRRIRWVGMNKDTFNRFAKDNNPWEYDITELGFKYNMNDIIASIGIIQLNKLDDMNESRRRVVDKYNDAFKSIPWLKTPVVRDNVKPAYWLYILRIDSNNRDLLMKYLFNDGILANTNFKPLHLMSFFNKYYSDKRIVVNCPIAEREWRKIVILPLYPYMKNMDIEKVISTVFKYK